MKTNKILQQLSMAFIALFFLSSCSSNDDSSNNNTNNDAEIQQINSDMQSGTWRITSFIDSGQDETSDFAGYNFTFMANGTLNAANSSSNLNGTWSVLDSSNSLNSSSNDDIDFNIFFNVPLDDPFEDLNDDWDIVSHSSNQLDLIDISGGNGGTDTLTFVKN